MGMRQGSIFLKVLVMPIGKYMIQFSLFQKSMCINIPFVTVQFIFFVIFPTIPECFSIYVQLLFAVMLVINEGASVRERDGDFVILL